MIINFIIESRASFSNNQNFIKERRCTTVCVVYLIVLVSYSYTIKYAGLLWQTGIFVVAFISLVQGI